MRGQFWLQNNDLVPEESMGFGTHSTKQSSRLDKSKHYKDVVNKKPSEVYKPNIYSSFILSEDLRFFFFSFGRKKRGGVYINF